MWSYLPRPLPAGMAGESKELPLLPPGPAGTERPP